MGVSPGAVTVLFTDIEASTLLWERHPQAMKAALARHDKLLRAAFENHGGQIFKIVGDQNQAAFSTAAQALSAAIAAQRALASEPWGDTGPLRVRMALHTDVVDKKDGVEYYGAPLNRVARIVAAGHGGQVLLSAAAEESLCDALPPGVALRDLGLRQLKGLLHPERIFQLVAPDLPSHFPPLRTAERPSTNLPKPATALVGAEQDASAVCRLILRPDVRVVTLAGPGNSAKARFCLQVAAGLLGEFEHGVCYVPPGSFLSSSEMVFAIAEALELKSDTRQSIVTILGEYLRDRQLLFVLDGLENVAESDRMVTELLSGSRRSKVLVSACRALGVYGEKEFFWKSHADSEILVISKPPFKGMQCFDESDADLFFGRDRLTDRLVERLLETRFLAVVGASGSGKSSLVRAGLIPALRRRLLPAGQGDAGSSVASGDGTVHLITPTSHPLRALASSLTRDWESADASVVLAAELARDPTALHLAVERALTRDGRRDDTSRDTITPPDRLLLVVDQFEELFTLCRDEAERRAFVDGLLAAAGGRTLVLIALRADFYEHCARFSSLREALATRQEYIGPMSADELRQAIEAPAALGGWELEPGLVDLLLQDVGDEPGALPLLSHALLETWQRRRWNVLTLKAYSDSGGVRGAIAKTAERVFQTLPSDRQAIARRTFLRLTELGEATQDTRRRATLAELIPGPEEGPVVEAVLRTLADARLITTGEGTVEVGHEALIREWQRLREWLAEDREGLRTHRRLTEATHEWMALVRDPGALYRGARLAQAAEWAKDHPDELNLAEREFLEASQGLERNELEVARSQANRLRNRAWALAVALIAALAMAVAAFVSSRQAQESAAMAAGQRVTAEAGQATAQAASALAVAEAVSRATQQALAAMNAAQAQANYAHAEAQRLAAEANALIQSGGNSDLIALLALRSMMTEYTAQGDAALDEATRLNYPVHSFRGHTGLVFGVAFSPDSRLALTGSEDGTARLWDTRSGEELRALIGHEGSITSVAWSPDGRLVLTASADTTARLWDAQTGTEVRRFSGGTAQVSSVVFSADGRYALGASEDGSARLWEVETGAELQMFVPQADVATSAALSPDGRYAMLGYSDKTARLLDIQSGELVLSLVGHTDRVLSVAFSSDGTRILTGSYDKTARLWDAQTGEALLGLEGHAGGVTAAVFSPDGRSIATASYDKTARVWDAQTGEVRRVITSHVSVVRTVAFSPDGRYLLTGGNEAAALLFDLQAGNGLPSFTGHASGVTGVAFSPDGRYALTGSYDNTARLWDAESGKVVHVLSGHTDIVNGVAFSPDGRLLLTASWDGTACLWDASTGMALRRLDHPRGPLAVAMSPDGRYVVTGGWDGTAILWDALSGAKLQQYTGHSNVVIGVAFSPDGGHVLTAGYDRVAGLWDRLSGAQIRGLVSDGEVSGVAFSPDGRYALTGSLDKTARLWDARTGEELRRYTGHTDGVFSVAFSPDGRYALTGSGDKTARLWDAQTGEELRRLSGHTASVTAVAFSPDGRQVLTGSDDGTATLWHMDYEAMAQYLCERLLRDFSDGERLQYGVDDQATTCGTRSN